MTRWKCAGCVPLFIYLFPIFFIVFYFSGEIACGRRARDLGQRPQRKRKKNPEIVFFSTSDASETTDPILSIDKMSRSDFLPFF